MTQSTWNETSFDWKEATENGRKLYGASYFLSVFNHMDFQNTDNNIIYVNIFIIY